MYAKINGLAYFNTYNNHYNYHGISLWKNFFDSLVGFTKSSTDPILQRNYNLIYVGDHFNNVDDGCIFISSYDKYLHLKKHPDLKFYTSDFMKLNKKSELVYSNYNFNIY